MHICYLVHCGLSVLSGVSLIMYSELCGSEHITSAMHLKPKLDNGLYVPLSVTLELSFSTDSRVEGKGLETTRLHLISTFYACL